MNSLGKGIGSGKDKFTGRLKGTHQKPENGIYLYKDHKDYQDFPDKKPRLS
jgi:hypothetical protein